MESLADRLEKDVGLTKEQAQRAVDCVKNYMMENDLTAKAKEAIKDVRNKTLDFIC